MIDLTNALQDQINVVQVLFIMALGNLMKDILYLFSAFATLKYSSSIHILLAIVS